MDIHTVPATIIYFFLSLILIPCYDLFNLSLYICLLILSHAGCPFPSIGLLSKKLSFFISPSSSFQSNRFSCTYVHFPVSYHGPSYPRFFRFLDSLNLHRTSLSSSARSVILNKYFFQLHLSFLLNISCFISQLLLISRSLSLVSTSFTTFFKFFFY